TFVPKLFASPILLAEDVFRLFRGFPPRNIYISEATVAVAGIIFLIFLFGLTRGKHFYRIRRETLYFPDLPEAFDGFTITQLSDIHSGSLRDRKGVKKGIELANAQNSDLLLFTGDLVNNMASEMDPWISDFAKLKAPYGKYAVLGNHDYGDYIRWTSSLAKHENLRRLKEIHAELGFNLLLNQSVTLRKQGQSIALIGVENWGKGGFHQYGDLEKALKGVADDSFKFYCPMIPPTGTRLPSTIISIYISHWPDIHMVYSSGSSYSDSSGALSNIFTDSGRAFTPRTADTFT